MNKYERNKNPKFWSKHHDDCNCGSFALDVTDWFCPYDNGGDYTLESRDELFIDLMNEGYSREDVMSQIMQYDVAEILRVCPWLEIISNPEDIADNERVIAYRLSLKKEDFDEGEIDEDFHFRVRIGGFWFEKCGMDAIRFCPNQNVEEAEWLSSDNLVYDGEIIFFRVKN